MQTKSTSYGKKLLALILSLLGLAPGVLDHE